MTKDKIKKAQKDDKRTKEFEKAYEEFIKAVTPEHDNILIVLRSHLFSENQLERIIRLKLSRGDRIIEQGNLGYYQKIVLVDSFDVIPDKLIQVLKNLNRIRNGLSHELTKELTKAEVERLGSPLGADYTRAKTKSAGDLKELLFWILSSICGYLNGGIMALEDHESRSVKKDKVPV